MNKRVILVAVGLVVLVLVGTGVYLLWPRGPRDLASALAEARAAQAAQAEATPAPTPTPDAAGLERIIFGAQFQERLGTARTLPDRKDVPADRRAAMLVVALQAEAANPSEDAPHVRDTYLPPGGVYRLTLVRSLADLGKDALPVVRRAVEGAEGLAREHLLVALAYLGDRDALPAVREVLAESADPVVRMDAARALGVAQDRNAIPVLTEALADPYVVEARDSLGEYTIYPVREQAFGALDALGVQVTRQPGDTFAVEGQ